MDRPPRFDRDYLCSQIGLGHEVLIQGVGIVSRAEDVPTQDELDLLHNPAAKVATPQRQQQSPPPPPTFAGRPLKAYAGKTDEQVAKMKDVTPDDVVAIRAAIVAADAGK